MSPAAFPNFWKGAARNYIPRWALPALDGSHPAEDRWRWRIRFFAGLLILIQIGFVAFMLTRAHDVALEEAHEHVEEAIRDAEADVNRALRQFDALLKGLPDLINIAPEGDLIATRRLLYGLAQQNIAARDLVLFDNDGVAIVSADAAGGRSSLLSLPPTLLQQFGGDGYRGVQIYSPWRNPSTGEISVLIGRRLTTNQLNARYAVAVAAASVLSDRFSTASAHQDMVMTLVSERGELLASQPPDAGVLGRPVADPKRLKSVGAGVWMGEGLMQSGRAVTGIAVVLDHGLHVIATIDLDSALQDWRKELTLALLVSFAISGLIVTFSVLLTVVMRQRSAAERALIDARDAAEAASRAKSSFLANMSHELRTPLNAIIGFSELIRDRAYGDDDIKRYSGYAGDIYASGEHLLGLINDILDLSKVEAGAFHLELEDIEIDAFMLGCLGMFANDAKAKGVRLQAPAQSGLTIRSDHRALLHILTNLISNAIKFTPAGGDVTVSAMRAQNGGLRLIVADTGAGIPRSHLATLFEPFQHSNAMVSRRLGGSGLGLSIVRSYVDLLGADIGIESELGVGTTITLNIPPVPPSR